jgi:hypothetical protein
MRGLTADFDVLDSCRRAMLGQAGQFGGIADGFSGQEIDASIFGTLPAAQALAGLSGQVDTAGHGQFCAAEKFLRGVERGLDSVRQGVADAEQANVDAIQTIG